MPVSYTHLDVYKRQDDNAYQDRDRLHPSGNDEFRAVYVCAPREGILECRVDGIERRPDPVSYTHLPEHLRLGVRWHLEVRRGGRGQRL